MRILLLALAVTSAFAEDASKQDPSPQTISALFDASPTVTVTRCPQDQHIVAVEISREFMLSLGERGVKIGFDVYSQIAEAVPTAPSIQTHSPTKAKK